MKSTFRILVIAALALAMLAQYSTAAAATEMYKWKGPGAQAEFYSEDGCVANGASIFTRDEKFHNPPGRPSKSPFAFLYLYQYDFCNQVLLMEASGFVSGDVVDLQVANRLDGATLMTTVNVYDWVNDTSFDVYVDLTWTATGPATRENSRFKSQTPDCKYQNQFKGMFRPADAYGTVTDGSTNFSPWTGWGSIFDSMGSEKWIGCGF